MNLNQRVMEFIGRTFLDHAMIYILIFCTIYAVVEYYNNFLRINKNTDNIDLIDQYIHLKMRHRYGPYL